MPPSQSGIGRLLSRNRLQPNPNWIAAIGRDTNPLHSHGELLRQLHVAGTDAGGGCGSFEGTIGSGDVSDAGCVVVFDKESDDQDQAVIAVSQAICRRSCTVQCWLCSTTTTTSFGISFI